MLFGTTADATAWTVALAILLLLAVIFLALCALVWGAQELRDDVQALKQQVNIMSAAFDDLKAAVAAETSLDASAVALIQGIADKLSTLPTGTSDADLKALADELRSGAAPLAAAVAANTPVDHPV